MFEKTTSMPTVVRNTFLANAIIAFLVSSVAVAITKSIEPMSATWAAVTAFGTCGIASAIYLLHRWPGPGASKEHGAKFLIGLSAYAFCALAAAVGALCAAKSTFDVTFTSLAICLQAIPAFHALRLGTEGATATSFDAVVARQRLRLLPMAQAACFYAIVAS